MTQLSITRRRLHSRSDAPRPHSRPISPVLLNQYVRWRTLTMADGGGGWQKSTQSVCRPPVQQSISAWRMSRRCQVWEDSPHFNYRGGGWNGVHTKRCVASLPLYLKWGEVILVSLTWVSFVLETRGHHIYDKTPSYKRLDLDFYQLPNHCQHSNTMESKLSSMPFPKTSLWLHFCACERVGQGDRQRH